jgi:hypothetical protein
MNYLKLFLLLFLSCSYLDAQCEEMNLYEMNKNDKDYTRTHRAPQLIPMVSYYGNVITIQSSYNISDLEIVIKISIMK